jgi:hypothetical protein
MMTLNDLRCPSVENPILCALYSWLLVSQASVCFFLSLLLPDFEMSLSGKSVFLLRLFLRHLALKLLTVLQTQDARLLLFCEEGVKEFTRPNVLGSCYPLYTEGGPANRIWALVDSIGRFDQPAPALQQSPFFIVQAWSPCSGADEWTKKVAYERFYMNPRSFTEVLQV